MKIIIDSNIAFSAILNSSSKIGQIISLGSDFFDFYSVDLLKDEIESHKDKLLKVSKSPESHINANINFIFSHITFFDSYELDFKDIKLALELTENVDVNDTPFVALTYHLKGSLWTGDKKLITGLRSRGVEFLLTTEELYSIYQQKQTN